MLGEMGFNNHLKSECAYRLVLLKTWFLAHSASSTWENASSQAPLQTG